MRKSPIVRAKTNVSLESYQLVTKMSYFEKQLRTGVSLKCKCLDKDTFVWLKLRGFLSDYKEHLWSKFLLETPIPTNQESNKTPMTRQEKCGKPKQPFSLLIETDRGCDIEVPYPQDSLL
jgi:hypothetical protein